MYLLLFLIGAIGFVAMAALGALHGVGGHRGHGAIPRTAHGHSHSRLPGHQPTAAGPAGHRGIAPAQAQQSAPQVRASATRYLVALSPLDIFSMCLGAGAAGTVLKPFVATHWLLFCAILGALVFDFGIVRPYMGFLMRFASRPSEGLEGTVYQEAEAITGFDASGSGLIRVVLDGQNVQLLAKLDDLEIDKGIRVRKGEKVYIVEVDAARNSCRVTRELAS